MTPLEVATSQGLGFDHSVDPLPAIARALEPRAALEQTIARGLRHPPCVVPFSGGRDSSAVLAVATLVARREGLPLPVPSTNLFPRFPETHEGEWQEMVIAHLRLPDWERHRLDSELNFLGPVARSLLRRHGIIGPAGVHDILPGLQLARGGTLLTGLEGDGLFGGGRFAGARAVLARRRSPCPRNLLTLLNACAPAALREVRDQRQGLDDVGWLRPAPRRELLHELASQSAAQPLSWGRHVELLPRHRYIQVIVQALAVLGEEAEVMVGHPLLDCTFLAALARAGGCPGLGSRTDIMQRLFSDLLPPVLLSRPTKASFGSMFWSDDALAFRQQWDGTGLPEGLVDIDALRTEWSVDEPDSRSSLLLQLAWLNSQPKAAPPRQS